MLRAELDRLQDEGLLGADVLGTGRRLSVEVFVSPGGYILGEETALLECMEGHRGEPRNKPPFPGVHGLWGKPTLINSVETLADVPVIAEPRRAVVAGPGRRRLGRAEVLRGLRARRASRASTACRWAPPCGRCWTSPVACWAGSGWPPCSPAARPSNFLGPDDLDARLDFDSLAEAGSMLGSGALVAMAEGTDLLAAATNTLRFFRDESCGKCVPCRVGSTKAHALLTESLAAGGLDDRGEAQVLELERTLRTTSICGLGQVALGPVASVLGLRRGWRPWRDQPGGHGREFFTTTTVGAALGLLASPRTTPVERVALADALGRTPAAAGHRRRRAAGVRPVHRRRLRGRARPTRSAPPRACPPTSTWRGRSRWAARPR